MNRLPHFIGCFGLLAGASSACSGTAVTDGSGGAATTTTSSSATSSSSSASGGATGVGGSTNYDLSECNDNVDCPGGECFDINGGYKACKYPVVEATSCTGSQLDECCDSSECGMGEQCLAAPLVPYCGGPQMEPHNACGSGQCASNDDCNGGVCVPAGVVGNQVAMCVMAECFGTICGLESLSSCALVRDPCCGGPAGFLCIDPDGCQSTADCSDGYCEQGVCKSGGPTCPL